jgi:hypothetical protein
MNSTQMVILVVVRFGLLVGAVGTFFLGMSLPRAVGDPLVITALILSLLYFYFWFRVRWLIKESVKKMAADYAKAKGGGEDEEENHKP